MNKALSWVAGIALLTAGCSSSLTTASPTAPSAVSIPSASLVSASSSAAVSASAVPKGLSDVTLANAGWSCIQPGNNLTLCAPPGLGLPPIPPAANGQPTYDIMAFTLNHEFVHHVKLLRPDLYQGQPCLGGEPWSYVDFLAYYECIIPGHGE